jgi:hypothetical protein
MRTLLLLPLLALLAAPAAARADLTLHSTLSADGAAQAPPAHLVPPLQVGALTLDPGSGAGGGGTEPVLALVLGIFPGFGLGHYVAGAPWQKWALIDTIVLIAAIVVTAADLGVLEILAWIALVVEHVIEGIDAYGKAGGKVGARASPRTTAVALGPPAPVRGASPDLGLARPPEVVLARF